MFLEFLQPSLLSSLLLHLFMHLLRLPLLLFHLLPHLLSSLLKTRMIVIISIIIIMISSSPSSYHHHHQYHGYQRIITIYHHHHSHHHHHKFTITIMIIIITIIHSRKLEVTVLPPTRCLFNHNIVKNKFCATWFHVYLSLVMTCYTCKDSPHYAWAPPSEYCVCHVGIQLSLLDFQMMLC